MITLLITDRERGDDADGVAMGPNYYRVIIDDGGKVRVLELSHCSRTWDWVWTPIEDGCWPELEEEIKAEALDRFVGLLRDGGDLWDYGCQLNEDWASDPYFKVPIRLGADS